MGVVDGKVTSTDIGYTTNEEHSETLNTPFSNMISWLESNKEDLESGTIDSSVYFDTNLEFNYISGSVTDVSFLGLNEITDISEL
jgi:hypothetical protein